ncbi:DnaJ family molecular chaperone [Myxococcus sp. AB025B]|uniref:J domain-containing protein n=1 Tax=Myxococcus sp. AB025B TaxID=2562794 RepID=UPI0018913232|nr:J domain-containing protein [Myxococcus sp. AB025B]
MTDPGFSDDFLDELRELRELEARRDTAAGRAAAEEELRQLNLYQVAANSGEARDPAGMGEIERLLHTHDTSGLEARLGEGPAQELLSSYLAAWRQVESDRYFANQREQELLSGLWAAFGVLLVIALSVFARRAWKRAKQLFQAAARRNAQKEREEQRARVAEEARRREAEARARPEVGHRDRPFDPHEILGVARGCSKNELRRAYHAQMAQYHPDKVAHLGKELRELAERKALEINRAYEMLS